MDLMDIRRGLMMGMEKGIYKKIYSGEIQCSTNNTNLTNIATITVDGAYTDREIIYTKIRNKAGKQDGYHYGNDCFTVKGQIGGVYVYKYDGSITVLGTSFGVYVRSINQNGTMTIAARYNQTYTSTIDGTYTIEVYTLNWPNDDTPFYD